MLGQRYSGVLRLQVIRSWFVMSYSHVAARSNHRSADWLYPELEKALETAEWDDTGQDYSANSRARTREVVDSERERTWSDQPTLRSTTEVGRADSEADGSGKRRHRSNRAEDCDGALAIERAKSKKPN